MGKKRRAAAVLTAAMAMAFVVSGCGAREEAAPKGESGQTKEAGDTKTEAAGNQTTYGSKQFDNVTPVSYTHLDVYKRQAIHRAPSSHSSLS